MFHVKHSIKIVWNRKKFSGNRKIFEKSKETKKCWKTLKSLPNSIKTGKTCCKTVLLKCFTWNIAKNLQFSYVSHRRIMQKCRKCFTWNISSSKIRRSMIKYLCPNLGQFWDRIWRNPQIDWHRKENFSYLYAKTPAAWIIFLKEVPAGHFL